MRIALVIPRFDPHVGGAERWTYDFAAKLARHGHDVHVFAERFAPFDARLTAHTVDVGGLSADRRRFSFAAAVEDLLRGDEFDVVHDQGHGWHCNVFMPHGGTRGGSFRQNLLLMPPALRWVKRRVAAWLPRYRSFRQLEAEQYQCDGSRLFVALSKMVAQDMRQFHAVPEPLVRIVYNGVDVARFSPRARERHRRSVRRQLGVDSEMLFLLVGHNFRLKGVATAVRALADIARRGASARLVVLGGDRPRRYERLARRLGAEDRVQFIGAARDSVPYYAAADVLVHPTYYDPCSLVVLEALAAGLPVVTSRFNGAGELIESGQQGFVIDDPADAASVADAMWQLCDDERRRACGEQARLVAERHDLDRNYRDLLRVYEEAKQLNGTRATSDHCEWRAVA